MRKKKEKVNKEDKQTREPEYQYLVTLQTRLDYKGDDTSPVAYLKIFDKKPQAVDYIESLITKDREYYEKTFKKEKIEIKDIKRLSNATIIKWHRADTKVEWTWIYEIYKIEYEKDYNNNNIE